MAKAPYSNPDYLDEVHQDISEFAARHYPDDDDADERDQFVNYHMERRGYKTVQHTSFAPPDPEPPAPKGGQGGGRGGQGRGSYFGGGQRR